MCRLERHGEHRKENAVLPNAEEVHSIVCFNFSWQSRFYARPPRYSPLCANFRCRARVLKCPALVADVRTQASSSALRSLSCPPTERETHNSANERGETAATAAERPPYHRSPSSPRPSVDLDSTTVYYGTCQTIGSNCCFIGILTRAVSTRQRERERSERDPAYS